jgi:hypothetical protein
MLSEVCMMYRSAGSYERSCEIIFNRTEGKLKIVVLKEFGPVRVVTKSICPNLFDCNWAIEVSNKTKSSSPPLRAI